MLNYFFVLTQMHMHYWTIRMTIFRSQTVLGCQRLIELCCETEPPTLSTERISHWFPCRGCERLTCCAWILSPHRSPANALDLNFDTQPSRSQQSVSLNWLNRRGKHLPSSWCIHWSRWIHPATRDTHTSSVFPTESLFHSVCAWLWVCVCVCIEPFPNCWQIKRNISVKLLKGQSEHKLQGDLFRLVPHSEWKATAAPQ